MFPVQLLVFVSKPYSEAQVSLKFPLVLPFVQAYIFPRIQKLGIMKVRISQGRE
ncbi:hypothetical protein D931_01269 [Enterococcus faecium 13.SD.W.09]|nr:hypothetical protein D931_01269 [Enterococcus faecium 13.SD.W.09]